MALPDKFASLRGQTLSGELPDVLAALADGPAGSIHDATMTCDKCGWSGKVYDCEPDIDGDGGLGCPKCKSVAKMADGPTDAGTPTEQPRTFLLDREKTVGLVKAAQGALEVFNYPGLTPRQWEAFMKLKAAVNIDL